MDADASVDSHGVQVEERLRALRAAATDKTVDTSDKMLASVGLPADFAKRDQLWRSFKIIRQLENAVHFQFVLADQALAVVMDNPRYDSYIQSGYMRLDTRSGYTTFRDSPIFEGQRKVHYYNNVPRAKVLWDLIKALA